MAVDNEAASRYVGLLFALRDADLEAISGSFVNHLLGLLQYLERYWRRLVADLRSGRLGDDVEVTEEVRAALNALLQPEPERAQQLEAEFSKGFDDILPRIFPRLKCITSNHSGSSMAAYKERCTPYTGDVPILSYVYICTEGLLGVNMRPSHERPGYALLPRATYIEFLPVDGQGQSSEGQQPLQAHQVEVGKLYEVVLTNASGFYRYRLGDVVEVVGFYNQIPLMDFMFRTGQMLNVFAEKVSEASFTSALLSAARNWPGLQLRDFTAAESVLAPGADVDPPHYLVFVETDGGTPTDQQAQMIDAALCEQHVRYKPDRANNTIGAMEVIPVAEGTFSKYREHLISNSALFNLHFKQPRVLRTEQQVKFFLDRRIQLD